MTNRRDFNRPWGFAGVLNGMDYTSSGQEQDQNDEHRNHGPGEFYLVAAVDGSGFTAVVIGSLAEFDDGIRDEGEHNYENDGGNREYKQRQMNNRIGVR